MFVFVLGFGLGEFGECVVVELSHGVPLPVRRVALLRSREQSEARAIVHTTYFLNSSCFLCDYWKRLNGTT